MNYREILNKRKNTERYAYFKFGDDYYKGRNTNIMERRKKIVMDGYGAVDNPFMANHKLPSGHLKLIVDQKVNYLLGNGITFEEEQDLDLYFQNNFYEDILDLATTASKKAEAWLYMYKENNQLKFTEVAPEQLAQIYDERGILVAMIRQYEEDTMLVYTKDGVEKYKLEKNRWNKKESYGHYAKVQTFNGKVESVEESNFGVVPFIPLYNNSEKMSDLYPIKPMIDVRDIINSDFANNIDDMQDAFFILKGYSGGTNDLVDFMHQLKSIKAVPVDADGAVDTKQLEVPVEARKEFLDRIDKDIFRFSMAVDTDQLVQGNVTNVAIKAMMMNLDLKADQFETQIRRTIKKIIEYINRFDGKAFTDVFTLERSMIANKAEAVESLQRLIGVVSMETLISLLPYDINVEDEIKRLEEERAVNPISLGDVDATENE